MIYADIHTHSVYSRHRIWGDEAFGTPKEMIKMVMSKGLNGLAITDHDSVKGSIEGLKYSKKIKNFVLIPGSEVSSADGHILALGIKENVRKGLSVQETIDKIHELGGIAIAVHPYVGFPRTSGVGDAIRKYRFDAIEVLNGGIRWKENKKAYDVARELNYPMTGGSDAHYWKDVGTIYNIINCGSDVDEVLKAIKKGKVIIKGKPFGFYSKMRLATKKVLRSITRRL
ncbi:MAG: CehA/McbA family metallohydrolase [Candidatus Aenigmarchaeota archaeon]|nr:CehA/McbA family metallohydrolase [Candidatus Aenigmarchaeota archaeon]